MKKIRARLKLKISLKLSVTANLFRLYNFFDQN